MVRTESSEGVGESEVYVSRDPAKELGFQIVSRDEVNTVDVRWFEKRGWAGRSKLDVRSIEPSMWVSVRANRCPDWMFEVKGLVFEPGEAERELEYDRTIDTLLWVGIAAIAVMLLMKVLS